MHKYYFVKRLYNIKTINAVKNKIKKFVKIT